MLYHAGAGRFACDETMRVSSRQLLAHGDRIAHLHWSAAIYWSAFFALVERRSSATTSGGGGGGGRPMRRPATTLFDDVALSCICLLSQADVAGSVSRIDFVTGRNCGESGIIDGLSAL